MNDPGLDAPAQQAAEDVEENVYEADKEKAEAEEQVFLDPSRWWFASTACPLIAGTFGPIANAFSICALVEKWRVYLPPGVDEGHGTKVEDPKWLVAVNSISLVLALVANMALLLNMTRRLSFAIAQPITIIGWFLASFMLIALVAVASASVFRIQPATEHALSQAFYYGIIAAGLYFIIASLMVLTVYGAYRGHYPKEFRLTASQRTLMLQTISFVFYLLVGALVFSKVEGWNFLDAVYWADFTLLTVGVGGEFVPKTHTGRTLLFFYAIGGVVSLGLVIGSIRSLVLERGKEKMSARFLEMKRRRVLASMDEEKRTIKLGLWEKIEFSEKGLSEAQRREQEFNVMRRIQTKSERKRRYTALAMSSTAALLLWFLGALVFMHSEKPQGWSYFVSMYFSYTSLLTIGYGDYSPTSNSGKAFFVFWSLLAVPTLTILISNMGDTVIKAFRDLTIWVGSFTVLPGEHGVSGTLKSGIQQLKVGKIFRDDDSTERKLTGRSAAEQTLRDRLAEHIEEDELAEAEEAGEHGNKLDRDIHFYHYVLAKELRKLMRDADASPPKQYTYQEWNYYLRLIGQDENDTSAHRKPRVQHERKPHSRPDLGSADEGERIAWSWLGVRSPLMGNKSEAEWLLQRISATLELEMDKLRSSRAKREPPPISMADLRNREGRSGSDAEQDAKKGLGATEARRRLMRDM
ncbi:voltage-gated potassium channel [Paraphaeosphaeria sporulosa]|uniref:Voltage-gated potassium channel n=1 Tax=Paraphaeosphaeria sporulosa TaxID=1460663 RepID=A0A177CHU3_9PLEO|nr:voltage-gated potassium channel [Paraphaeosphaeria sporulosa]OAG06886.1 voltage-gated potassium channel [Paraphaeosphaeria sporulosa]